MVMERVEQKELCSTSPSRCLCLSPPPFELSSQTTDPDPWNSHSSATRGRVVEEVLRCIALRRGGKLALHAVSPPYSLNESVLTHAQTQALMCVIS